MLRPIVLASFVAAGLAACGDPATLSGPGPAGDPGTTASLPPGDATRGADLFGPSCGPCHTAANGVDLRAFSYDDATIARRALLHVDAQAAADVVAFIHSLAQPQVPSGTRMFQPGGEVLASDADFGVANWGSDAGPAGWTVADLRARDPRTVKIALALMPYADEGSDYEWMPSHPLPPGVRASIEPYLQRYFATRSDDALRDVVSRGNTALHDETIADAPCVYQLRPDFSRYDPEECFDGTKWLANLVLQHGLARGDAGYAVSLGLNTIWWETGHMAHKSQQFHEPLPDVKRHIAGWTYASWQFDFALTQNTLYSTEPFASLGLRRHATWIALRTLVARDPSAFLVCSDVENLGQDGFAGWAYPALRLAYTYVLENFRAGHLPPSDARPACRDNFRRAIVYAQPGLDPAQTTELEGLRDQVLALLGP